MSWDPFSTEKRCEKCGKKGVSTVVYMHKAPERLCKSCFKKAKKSEKDLLDLQPSI